MPSKSEQQRRFFYAVKECKEKGNCTGALKKAAKSMTAKEIEKYLTLKKSK